jgi:hypothetical protein
MLPMLATIGISAASAATFSEHAVLGFFADDVDHVV